MRALPLRAPTPTGTTMQVRWVLIGGTLPRHLGAICTKTTACNLTYTDAEVEASSPKDIPDEEVCPHCMKWILEDRKAQLQAVA